MSDLLLVQRVTERIRMECALRKLGRAPDERFDAAIDYLADLGDDLCASSTGLTSDPQRGERARTGPQETPHGPSEEVRVWLVDIDQWIDDGLESSLAYSTQPLAKHWARVSKIGEELGETIEALIAWTGANPRKSQSDDAQYAVFDELCDTILTAMLALLHFHKDADGMFDMLWARLRFLHARMLGAQVVDVRGEALRRLADT